MPLWTGWPVTDREKRILQRNFTKKREKDGSCLPSSLWVSQLCQGPTPHQGNRWRALSGFTAYLVRPRRPSTGRKFSRSEPVAQITHTPQRQPVRPPPNGQHSSRTTATSDRPRASGRLTPTRVLWIASGATRHGPGSPAWGSTRHTSAPDLTAYRPSVHLGGGWKKSRCVASTLGRSSPDRNGAATRDSTRRTVTTHGSRGDAAGWK